MSSALNNKAKAIVVCLVAEYSNVFTSSRRLELLKEWINLLKGKAYILFKARHVGLLCNGTTSTYVSKNEGPPYSDLRIFMRLHRPALIYILMLGIYHAIASLRSLMRIYKNIWKHIYIILYGTEYIPWLYLVPLYITLKGLSSIAKIKTILIHDYVDLYLMAYRYSKIERFLYNILESISLKISSLFYSSSIITTGYLLSRGVERDKIIYFPPLASKEFERERGPNVANDRIVLVYTGNISKELSSFDLLLSALADLDEDEKRSIRVNLILLVGKGNLRDLEKLQKLLRDKELESVVNVKVNRPLHEVAELASNSHIGLALLDPKHPATKQMDFPLKVAEYLCSGTPVIYTNFGRVRFFLKHGFHGLMVEYKPESIKEVIRSILSNSSLLNELARNVNKVRKRFCLSTIAHELLVETLKRVLLI